MEKCLKKSIVGASKSSKSERSVICEGSGVLSILVHGKVPKSQTKPELTVFVLFISRKRKQTDGKSSATQNSVFVHEKQFMRKHTWAKNCAIFFSI